jgi:hypothetical protein
MKKIVVVILHLALLVCSSCAQNQEKIEGEYNIDINRLTTNAFSSSFNLSSLSFTMLDSNMNCLLSSDFQIHSTKDHYLIYDFMKGMLYKFDSSGKFNRVIGTPGRGPEEYENVISFIVDTPNHTIELLTSTNIIKRYSIEGSFKNSWLAPVQTLSFAKENDTNYWFYSGINSGQPIHRLHYGTVDSIQQKFLPLKTKCFGAMEQNFYNHSSIYFKETFFPVIYKLNSNSIEPYYVFNFGKHGVTEKDFEQCKDPFTILEKFTERGFYTIVNFIEGYNSAYFRVQFQGANDQIEIIDILLDKKSGKYQSIKYPKDVGFEYISQIKCFKIESDRHFFITDPLSFNQLFRFLNQKNVNLDGNHIIFSIKKNA